MSNSDLPHITLVTNVLNGVEHLETCIHSVLKQDYPNLEYIILDGGSTDGSLEMIKKYEEHITLVSMQPDKGLYGGIEHGLNMGKGEIMGWLNCDDLLLDGSLHKIGTTFRKNPKINWINGQATVINARGEISYQRKKTFQQWSLYRQFLYDDDFIQQESTFWRRELWEKCGARLDLNFRYAADFDLWSRFFLESTLFSVPFPIGAFRDHSENQISSKNRDQYLEECLKVRNERMAGWNILKHMRLQLLVIDELLIKVPLLGALWALTGIRAVLWKFHQ